MDLDFHREHFAVPGCRGQRECAHPAVDGAESVFISGFASRQPLSRPNGVAFVDCGHSRFRNGHEQPVRQWEFLDGDTELLPGVSTVVTQGHTRAHQGVKIESEGRIAFFLGDLIPTVSHLPLPYIMGYDLQPMQTLETKRWVLDRAFEAQWLLVFEHDPAIQMGYVRKDAHGKYFLEAV